MGSAAHNEPQNRAVMARQVRGVFIKMHDGICRHSGEMLIAAACRQQIKRSRNISISNHADNFPITRSDPCPSAFQFFVPGMVGREERRITESCKDAS